MLSISISSELAAEHPRFMVACAASGREIHMFDPAEEEIPRRREPTGADGQNRGERSDRTPALHEEWDDNKRR